jgi:hypothetical protein
MEEARQQMRDTGRQLFGLAVRYMSCSRDLEPVLEESRGIGRFYGQQCAEHGVSLVEMVHTLFFFFKSLM